MTFYSSSTPAAPEPTVPKPVPFIRSPIIKLAAYVLAWFIVSTSLALVAYAFLSVGSVGGTCASGNTAYAIQVQCPQLALEFGIWPIFTGLFGVLLAVTLAGGIGIQIRVWAWPALFIGGGVLFLLGGGVVGWLCGILFLLIGLVPLALELKASVQRVFLGSFNIFGQQFRESPKAQPSFSSRKMPNPPDAIKPGIGDWAIDILGFIVPAIAGLYVATIWVAAVTGATG
jgi:hypothetical protein